MGSKACDQIAKNDEAAGSDATIEIKIKTLDSQTYTLRVDKQMPVPALKEQIASVTGVLSEQQRLICRGKVLKDDQLLSAYHVEDGHTLHLVVRQPVPSLSEGSASQPAADPASDMSRTRGRSIVIETISLPHQGDGVPPEISRIVSAILGSFGIPHTGTAVGGTDVRDHGTHASERILSGSTQQQDEQAGRRGQSDRVRGIFELPRAISMGSLQPPVITDSLTTLSQCLSQMRREFDAIGRGEGNDAQEVSNVTRMEETTSNGTMQSGSVHQGLPSPASLAEVMLSTRQIFLEQAGDSLLQLARQLQDQENVIDPLARSNIQTTAWRTGVLFHNLGATLLELGRTIMTLRLGQAPAEAVVNAGPAVFISPSGPNPLMVQPFPFQSGASVGALPTGTTTAASGMVNGLGNGLLPRRIDIQIRRDSSMPASNISRDESGDTERQSGHRNLDMNSGSESHVNQATPRVSEGPTLAEDSGVRVLPVRTVVAAVPSSFSQLATDPPGNRMGLYYPVLGRMQHGAPGLANGTRESQASGEHNPAGVQATQESSHESARQQEFEATAGSLPAFNIRQEGPSEIQSPGSISINILSAGGSQNNQDSERQMPDSMLQFLQNLFPGSEVHVEDAVLQRRAASSDTVHGDTSNAAAAAHGADGRVTDEGMFLSNLLQQIMPIISQNSSAEPNAAVPAEANASGPRMPQGSSHQAENSNTGTSRRASDSEPSPPNSKRQKME